MTIRVSRRDLLAAFGISFLSCNSFSRIAESADREIDLYASAYMDQSRRFGVAVLDQDGKILFTHPLPDRGHGMAFTFEHSLLVAFARRPGNFALAIDMQRQQTPVLFKSPPHTHFYGHGVFSSDGKLLFATENDYEGGRGLIGIYDTTREFARMGEIPSYGIGPHEVILMPDGRTLCVSNGGILTHPDTGRMKLNLFDMQSSVAFIDSNHGELVAKFDMPEPMHRLSLRHMAVDHERTVWLGGQYEGNEADHVPLIAKVDRESGLDFPDLGPIQELGLANYVGSVASSSNGRQIAFSSPKGNSLITIDVDKGIILQKKVINEVCGVASAQESFLTTSLSGEINRRKYPKYWDNHITFVGMRMGLESISISDIGETDEQ